MSKCVNVNEILKASKKYFEDFISRSTYHSNAIEGSTLSFAETYALLFDNKYSNIENANAKEIYEAINHKYALNKVLDRISEGIKSLDEPFLTAINQTINHNIMYVGGYRLSSIRIIGSDKSFPLPNELEEIMNRFFEKYNSRFKDFVCLRDLAEMHLEYENIHPYPDGNGRTGRLIINYFLLSDNQSPIVVPFENRKQYLQMMEANDIDGLEAFFEKLQKSERVRMLDFIEMDQEKNRQMKRSNENRNL